MLFRSKIIAIPVSDYLSSYSKDINVKAVLSCTIIDQRVIKKYNFINKAVNQIIQLLLKNSNNKITKYHVTKNKLYVNYNSKTIKYDSMLSGYIRRRDPIPYYGNNKSIALVGMYNKKGITTLNKSIESSIEFLESEGYVVEWKSNKYSCIIIYLICLLLVLVLIKAMNTSLV